VNSASRCAYDDAAASFIPPPGALPGAQPAEPPGYLMKQHAQTRGGGWQRMWDEGAGEVIKRREAWLDRHAAMLTAVLTAP